MSYCLLSDNSFSYDFHNDLRNQQEKGPCQELFEISINITFVNGFNDVKYKKIKK